MQNFSRQAPFSGLGGCRTWSVKSENRPQRGQFLPDLQPHSPAMGQKDGGKWTAAADLQPTTSKSDRLLGQAGRCDRDAPIHGLEAHDPAIMSERYVAAVPYQQIDPKNRSSNQKISGFLPPERAWMAKLLHTTGPRGGWSTFIACCVQKPRATPILDGAAAVRPDPTTWGGGWTAS